MELYSSATALLRIYQEKKGSASATPKNIVDDARQGKRVAVAALRELGTNLGRALASAATVVAPDVIIIGGGLSGAGNLLLGPTREAFLEQVFFHVGKAKIVRARLGNRAGVVGAALSAGESALAIA